MKEPKKCPFCGGKTEVFKNEELGVFSDSNRYAVKCRSCFCGTGHYKDVNRAIEAWNIRKPMERIVERLDSECKKHCDATRTYIGSDENDLGLRHLSKANAFCKAIEIVKDEGGV